MTVFDCPLEELRRRTSIKWTRWEPDVLPMFIAEMDCRMPEPIARRLQEAMATGDTGYPEQPIYQEAYADFARWRWGWDVDTDRFTTSGDVMQGMRYTLELVTEPGDGVVINPPIYPPFRQIIDHTRRQQVEVPLVDGRLDLDGMERAFADGARAALLCSPHNPTGTVHTREELTALAELGVQYDVTIIVDEIHSPFNGKEFTPFLSLPDVGKAVVSTSGAKAFNLAGLKAGLLIASDESLDVLGRLPSYVGEAMSHFGAIAHATGLTECRDWLVEAKEEIDANKRLFADLLAEHIPQLTYTPSEATYLAWLDCSALGVPDPGRFFHEEGRVRFNLGSEFASETATWVRINLATSQDMIREAVARMEGAVNRTDS